MNIAGLLNHFSFVLFLLCSLLECAVSEVREEVKQSLKPYLQKLIKITNKGVEIVIKILKKE